MRIKNVFNDSDELFAEATQCQFCREKNLTKIEKIALVPYHNGSRRFGPAGAGRGWDHGKIQELPGSGGDCHMTSTECLKNNHTRHVTQLACNTKLAAS